ncbi:MAG TPA: glycosyltransferase family 4 protein [Candidatus Methylomirabilis sp.]|nr:glycosyltransferase family 4 protein [Candidatus Methylomirabilis sp.]
MVQRARVLTETLPAADPTGSQPLAGRPARIARVITRLNVGGPARHAILLTAGMDRARFATTLITGVPGREEGDLAGLARLRDVEPVVVPELRRPIHPARDLAALLKLVRIFRAVRPDLVHTHLAKAGALGRVAARLTGVPLCVHTFHGHVLEGYFHPAVARIFGWIERGLARRTDRIVAISPRLREDILAMGIGRPEQVEVIPLGLDLARFRSGASAGLREAIGVARDTPLLGIVGRLVPIKDHPALFQALALLDGGDGAPHLVVVGDGERRQALERLASGLHLDSRIHFLGWRDDLEAILGELDVIICCSRNEGTPLALIEAMAAGVPVLSTDVGGVGDVVAHGETGWLVPPGDPAALAEAIRLLVAQPVLRARLATAGRAVALERHGVEGLIQRTEALYTRLLKEKQDQRRM